MIILILIIIIIMIIMIIMIIIIIVVCVQKWRIIRWVNKKHTSINIRVRETGGNYRN
jgi:flagellar basal body-associated protein FliL